MDGGIIFLVASSVKGEASSHCVPRDKMSDALFGRQCINTFFKFQGNLPPQHQWQNSSSQDNSSLVQGVFFLH